MTYFYSWTPDLSWVIHRYGIIFPSIDDILNNLERLTFNSSYRTGSGIQKSYAIDPP